MTVEIHILIIDVYAMLQDRQQALIKTEVSMTLVGEAAIIDSNNNEIGN